jgi:hypothetical protein
MKPAGLIIEVLLAALLRFALSKAHQVFQIELSLVSKKSKKKSNFEKNVRAKYKSPSPNSKMVGKLYCTSTFLL